MIIASNDSLEGIFRRKWFWCYEWFWLMVAGYVNIAYSMGSSSSSSSMYIYIQQCFGAAFPPCVIFMCYIHCVYTEISSENICPWYGSYIIQYEMRMDDCLKSDICPNLLFPNRWSWLGLKVFSLSFIL